MPSFKRPSKRPHKSRSTLLLVQFTNEVEAFRIPRKKLTEVLTYAYQKNPHRWQNAIPSAIDRRQAPNAYISLAFLTDARMGELHEQFMSIEGTTDVMSFESGSIHPSTGRVHLGDIAVCVDVARREAATRHKRVEEEVILYALHGLLHLLGFDDVDEVSQTVMKGKQEIILHHFGIKMD